MNKRALLATVFACVATPAAAAEETIVVTATRTPEPSFDLPVSIDSVGQDRIQDGQLRINLSESLATVPGIVVQNRQNYAQDLQISSRGFGAQATFGVRGVRLYVDGIPNSQPDGQGQVSNVDLGSAARIEVLRGPFSALYGNSAGGVISVFTEDGKPGLQGEGTAEYGSFGLRRAGVKLSGEEGRVNGVLEVSAFRTDGSRDHARAKRGTLNGKVTVTLDEESTLTFIANAVGLEAQDPLGLTRQQYLSNPRQAGTGATSFNTRKTVEQEQFGLTYERHVGENDTVTLLAYGNNRAILQYQAIPLATQAPPSSPGGIIDRAVGSWGGDLRWTTRHMLGGMRLRVTVGVSADRMDEARRGFQNFRGARLGVRGALRRNEANTVFNVDEYLQAALEPDPRWLIEAGLRHSRVPVISHDRYIVPGNGNDSGSVRYEATTPVVGATWRADPAANLYASYGKGFQTPTFDQLSYRSTGGTVTGLNLRLRPTRGDNYEVGIKGRPWHGLAVNLAGFHIDTSQELAIQANSGGRAVYQNVGATTRDGVEVGLDGHWVRGFGTQVAYSYLRAVTASAYRTCFQLPCVLTVIHPGSRLPGVPLHSLFTVLSWKYAPSGFSVGLETRVQSRVKVNDAGTDAAPFTVNANLRAGFSQEWGGMGWSEFLRIDNLADRKYAGSVIVDESNARYFEPAPGRTVYVGVTGRFGG